MDIERAKKLANELNWSCFDMSEVSSKEYTDAIETVLSELEKKDKEIEKLKKDNKELLRKLRNRVKEVNKLTKYSLYKKEFLTLNKQLEKKEAIINEMAEWMAGGNSFMYATKEQIIEEFTNEVEREGKQYE